MPYEPVRQSSTDSSLAALAMSVWYLSRMFSVSFAVFSSIDVDVEDHQRAGPVEGLGHARCLLEVHLADRAHDAGDLVGEAVGDPRHLGEHDLLLALQLRVVDVEVQAATLERLGQLTGVVRREEHERDLRGGDRAELGDRHLVVGEDLEQQRLGLDLDAVDLVDQQHDGLRRRDRLEQRAGEQELVGEDVVLDVGPVLALARRHARSGCAGAASCSSTRRGLWTRRGPRSTGGGSAWHR